VLTADPTRIAIDTDPRTCRMTGVTAHGLIPFDVPFITEIAPGLWQGGCTTGLILPRHIKHVVSLYPWERYKARHGLASETYVRMLDSTQQATAQVPLLAAWVNLCRKDGPTLVHCQAGLNRSSLVAAMALMLEGATADAAIALIREKRSPACLCNPAFEEWLREKPVPPPRALMTTSEVAAMTAATPQDRAPLTPPGSAPAGAPIPPGSPGAHPSPLPAVPGAAETTDRARAGGDADTPALARPPQAPVAATPLTTSQRPDRSPVPRAIPDDARGTGTTPLAGKDWRAAMKAATSKQHAARRATAGLYVRLGARTAGSAYVVGGARRAPKRKGGEAS
jgi:protein-tyrosine phosphatase